LIFRDNDAYGFINKYFMMTPISSSATPQITTIATGLRFPEGPIAMDDGSFLVVEIEKQCLSRIDPNGKVTPIAMTGGGPNGAAMGPDGFCYVCNNGGHEWREDAIGGLRPVGPSKDYQGGWIDRINVSTGQVHRLHEASDKSKLHSPNDIVFDSMGGFWFTDLGKGYKRYMERGAVCYSRDGIVKEVIFPLLTPNGIGLSRDEKTLFVAETQTARLWAFELSAAGVVKKVSWPQSINGGQLLRGSTQFQFFDSLAVDFNDNICVATVFNGGITVVSSDATQCRHIAMPDYLTTNICFGGQHSTKAYITLSSTGKLVSVDWQSVLGS